MGRIQSIQSFSTVDGPGTRCVVFLQGCACKCIFCHNPDSWSSTAGEDIGTDALLRRLEDYRPFLRSSGLTISGGEPLCQPDYTREVAKKARAKGWHVAIDTSGWGAPEPFETVTRAADLVLFSIKHPLDPLSVSCVNQEDVLRNLDTLTRRSVPVWLRYVLIPGLTDSQEALLALGAIAARHPNVEKIQILPFSRLGEEKWKRMGTENALFNSGTIPIVSEVQIKEAENIVMPFLQGRASADTSQS